MENAPVLKYLLSRPDDVPLLIEAVALTDVPTNSLGHPRKPYEGVTHPIDVKFGNSVFRTKGGRLILHIGEHFQNRGSRRHVQGVYLDADRLSRQEVFRLVFNDRYCAAFRALGHPMHEVLE